MKVRDLIKGTVQTVREDDDLALALALMGWTNVRHLPVVRGEEVVGVLSQRDAYAYMANEKGRESLTDPVGFAMSKPARTIEPDADEAVAAERMAREKIGCLPVIENGKLIGIITATDLIAEEARGAQPQAEPPGATHEP